MEKIDRIKIEITKHKVKLFKNTLVAVKAEPFFN